MSSRTFHSQRAETREPRQRPEPERVLLYNWILRLLLESCFLSSMGFAKEEIVSFVRQSETYRQMSLRFRDRTPART